ncbi:unnamed protein product [Coregonus sp. 'balchen']|nr:unnamed protein product [Coregonus sp. 'balchen']
MRRAAATSSGAQGADSGKTTSTGPTIAKENGPTTPSPPVSPTTQIAPVDLEDEPQSSVTDATQMWMKFAKTFITVKQMWPYICQFVDKLFRETIEPAVKGANAHLSSFCFTKIDMGDKPLRVNGVKVYTENVDKRQIIMDLEISFVGNTEIDVDIKKYYCRAGIKSIQLHGVLRVVMEPLLGDMPLIGALSVFFLKKPLLDINWTGLTNMLDIPGLNGLCDNLIQDIIYSYLVLPNRITIPLVGEAQLAQLRFPIPKGVLRIHFLEAQDLLGKDKFLGGLIKGKSDPYGVLHIGNQLFQSKVVKENIHPKWNEVYEAMVYEQSGPQNLEIELFDEDTDQDDFLGSLLIDVAELQKEQKVDEVLTSIKADKGQANDGLSSALLVVYLDSARNLPSGKKVSSVPSPFVQFTVGHKTYESKTRYKTNEPVWEEVFTFLIHNPKCQELEVEVKDEKHECSLGTLNLPLVLCLEKLIASDQTSSVQVRKASTSNPIPMKRPSVSEPPNPVLDLPSSVDASTQELHRRGGDCEPYSGGPVGIGLADAGRSTSNLAISGSQKHLAHRGSTPSIASDISNPYATQELQQRLRELQNGSASHFPLGERRSGRRKTHTHKKTLNPVFDQIFEFSVSIVELHRRTLDVAVLVDLTYEDIAKGWTQWYELSEDGLKKPLQQL